MNGDSMSYEYLLKARQMTWENSELIDELFGQVTSKIKSGREEERHPTSYGNASRESHDNNAHFLIKQRSQQDNWKTKRNLHVHLDYRKVVNVRVLISKLDINQKTSEYNSCVESSKQPTVRSESSYSSEADCPTSLSEQSQEDDDNACSICHKKFKYKSELIRHLRTHTGEKPFSCPQCEKQFALKGDLKTHLLIHSGTKPFSCDICHKSFLLKSHLRAHRRTHTGDKPFECDTCNAMFSLKATLKAHMRTHTGETPYQCEMCEKKFSHRTGLRSHILTHTQEKLHECRHANCRKAFRSKSDLQRHILVHTGAKPYSCLKCHKRFTGTGSCKRHADRCPMTKNNVL